MLAISIFWFVIGVWVINEGLDIEHLFVPYSRTHPILGCLAYLATVILWPAAVIARKMGKI